MADIADGIKRKFGSKFWVVSVVDSVMVWGAVTQGALEGKGVVFGRFGHGLDSRLSK